MDAGNEFPRSVAGPAAGPAAKWRRWLEHPTHERTVATAFFLILTLVVLGPILFGPGDQVLSNGNADLALQFIHWRAFGFEQLRAGHLALWNPYIYGGTQYFGGFQSALLYPPNWLYLCLPLPRAVNVGIALHVFLAGVFMFAWVRQRGLHVLAGLLAGTVFMFGGPYFLHIYAGHLPNLCTMVWGPLILLAMDGWLTRRTSGWLLLGAGAGAMQILAGHPQYVFYTGIAAGLYCLPLLWRAPRRGSAAAGLSGMAVGAVVLSAVQLFEGFHAAGESIRSKGTSLEFAAKFSFPPENALTLLAPGFFGDMVNQPYWGRYFLWEMSLFFGTTGLVLAVYAVACVRKRETWICAGLAVVLLVLALGEHTPLFGFLYRHAPGFNKFRGWSKFTSPAMLFLVMLASIGFDALLRRGPPPRTLVVATLGGAFVLFLAAAWACWSAHDGAAGRPSPWDGWLHRFVNAGEYLGATDSLVSPAYVQGMASFASRQVLIAAGVLLASGAILLICRRRHTAPWPLLIVAVGEMLIFAIGSLDTFTFADAREGSVAKYVAGRSRGDYRVLNVDDPNEGMTTGAADLWGYDPGVLRRYAEWMAATQNVSPDAADQDIRIRRAPAVYASLLRCRYVFSSAPPDAANPTEGRGIRTLTFEDDVVAPHVMLVPRAVVQSRRDETFKTMLRADFEPRQTVVLESAPEPPPAEQAVSGKAWITGETTDSLTIEADVSAAAILVVTDAYSDGWHAHSLLKAGEGNQQNGYHIMPADYCLRAIPLATGHHRLILEYRPMAFVLGAWVSAISLAVYAGFAVGIWRGVWQRRKHCTSSDLFPARP